MKKYDWKRLERLNGGEKVFYTPPTLDTAKEVWFYVPSESIHPDLRVWRDGTIQPAGASSSTAPVTRRETLYDLREELFVDLEVRGNGAVIRRGDLNGAYATSTIAPGDVEALIEHYASLGFALGSPWHATKTRVTQRLFFDDERVVTLWVDGDVLVQRRRAREAPVSQEKESRDKHASREQAIAAAERVLQELAMVPLRLHRVEMTKAVEPNPPIPKSKAKRGSRA